MHCGGGGPSAWPGAGQAAGAPASRLSSRLLKRDASTSRVCRHGNASACASDIASASQPLQLSSTPPKRVASTTRI